MPSTYRSNISWKDKESHDWAKEKTEKEPGGLSGHIQRHFDRLRRKSSRKSA